MATIRASCDECRDVELTSKDVQPMVYLFPETTEDKNAYRFRCPLCKVVQVKLAEERTIDLLVASGCGLYTYAITYDSQEGISRDPITHDNVLDMHNVLKTIVDIGDIQFTRQSNG